MWGVVELGMVGGMFPWQFASCEKTKLALRISVHGL